MGAAHPTRRLFNFQFLFNNGPILNRISNSSNTNDLFDY